jgi:hypothetical protein
MESATPAASLTCNRVVEFLDDRFALSADTQGSRSGVFKKNFGRPGWWGKVQGATSGQNLAVDGSVSGLHVLHPAGTPTMAYLVYDSGSELRLRRTTDGLRGAGWGGLNGELLETNGNPAPTNYGQSIVFRNSIVWAHEQFSGAVGTGKITHYDLATSSLVRYNPNIAGGESSQMALHVHKNKLFLFGNHPTGNRPIKLFRLDAGAFVNIFAAVDNGGGSTDLQSPSTGHPAMFTDDATGDLIVFAVGVQGTFQTKVLRFVNAEVGSSNVPTNITSTVLGAVQGANKYSAAGGDGDNRRWVVNVDTESDPNNPRTFLTTWRAGFLTETWEWKGIGAEIEAVALLAGISDDFALPYNSVGGGHKSPRIAAVEVSGTPAEVVGGTRFSFRGRGSDTSGTVTFYGTDSEGTPDTVVPILAGSLTVGSGLLTDLEAYYHFDDDFLDASGNTLTLTETGTVTFAAALFNNGASFPGTNGNYLSRAKTASLELGILDTTAPVFPGVHKPFAVSFWVDVNALPGSSMYVCMQGDGSTDGWGIDITSTGAVRWIRGSTVNLTSSDAITAVAGLQHVVVTSTGGGPLGSQLYIYVDGAQVGAGNAGAIATTTTNFFVGNRSLNDLPLDGVLDELAIWSRYLLASEVTELYNGGSGRLITDTPTFSPTASISGNTIINFTPDNASTAYTVILDTSAAGVDIGEGDVGLIIADFA